MSDKIMIDTNILVYLYAKQPEYKYLKAQEIVNINFDKIIFSTQILGELYSVLTKKKLCSKDEAKSILIEIITTFPISEIDEFKVLKALDISKTTGFSYWDSLVISTALLNDCQFLYSEDMHNNQIIENKTQIINPLL